MADRNLNFSLTAKDQSVSSTFASAGNAGEKFSEKIGGAISGLGDKIGGEVGELVSQVGEGFEKIAENGTSSLQKLAIGGGVVAGLGVALQSFASSGEQSENQLKAAVIASGDSWDDYEGKVSKADASEAKYAHDSADTNNALRVLETATGSMDTALGDLTVTTDLAASKHESLADAAQSVGLIYGGNTKILKQYGIDMSVTAGNTDEANTAITLLAQKLSGQAAASADTFSGKVAGVKTEVQDWGEKVAGFIGGPLTMLGTVTGAVTGVMEISASAIALVKGRHAEAAIATLADSAAQDRIAATAAVAAGSEDTLAASAGAAATAEGELAAAGEASMFAMGPLGLALGAIAIVGGVAADKMGLFGNSASSSKTQINNLTDAIKADSGAIGENTRASVADALQKDGALAAAQKLGIGVDTLTDAALGNADAQKTVSDAADRVLNSLKPASAAYGSVASGASTGSDKLDAMANAADTVKDAIGGTASNVKQAVSNFNQLKNATDGSTDATEKHNDAVHANNEILNAQAHQYGDSVTAIQSANKAAYSQIQSTQAATAAMQLENDAAGLLTAALNQFNTGTLSVAQAQTALNSATLQANTTLKTNKGTLDQHTQAGIDDAQAIQGQVAALQASAEATAKTTGSSKQATTTYKDQATQLLDNIGKQWGIHSAVYATYQSLLDVKNLKLPPTIVDVNASQALAQLAAVKSAAEAISTPVVLNARIASGRVNSGHASGGTVGGQTIDEYGYEALNLPNGTTVIPHGQTQQMMRGTGGGGNIQATINLYSLVPTHETGKVIAEALSVFALTPGAYGGRYKWLTSPQ